VRDRTSSPPAAWPGPAHYHRFGPHRRSYPWRANNSPSSIAINDTWCYLPVMGFMTFNDEKEQYLFTAVLRPGNAVASVGADRDPRAHPAEAVAGLSPGAPARALGRRIRGPAPAGVSGRDGRGVCRGDGQKCGAEPFGRTRHAAGAETLGRQRPNRAPLCGKTAMPPKAGCRSGG